MLLRAFVFNINSVQVDPCFYRAVFHPRDLINDKLLRLDSRPLVLDGDRVEIGLVVLCLDALVDGDGEEEARGCGPTLGWSVLCVPLRWWDGRWGFKID